MIYNWNSRTELLLGKERLERFSEAHVLVVGLGGVGAYAAEQICRTGIGQMTIVDADTVNESNLNRQLPALHSTLGQPKAEVVAARLIDINPELKLTVVNEFLRDERTEEILDHAHYDFIVDAIDSLSPKVFYSIMRCCGKYPLYRRWVPVPRLTPRRSVLPIYRSRLTAHWRKLYGSGCADWAYKGYSGCLFHRDGQSGCCH